MSELATVYLYNFPLDVYLRAQEHSDELVREFVHISNSRHLGPDETAVPRRLQDIVEELTRDYGGMSDEVEQLRDDAIARGETRIDLTYRVPPRAAEAVRHLGRVFDEADDYCRAGKHLLTLATPPDALAFRHWYLGEFERQLAGYEPVPWPS